ncbi:MAG: hypothetical protein AAGJ93_05955 [Bacteroidota bacterium]
MRTLILLLMMSGATLSFTQENTQSAADYLTLINGLQTQISYTNMQYFRCAVHCQNAQDVENTRLELLQQVEQALGTVQRMPAPNEDDFIKNETVTFLQTLQSNCNGEYLEINNNFISPDDPAGAMEVYYDLVEAAELKLDRANDRFHRAFKSFAARNNINIIEQSEDEESEVALANRINAYYREVNKLDFEVQKELTRVVDALGTESYRKLEAARSNLERAIKRTKYGLEEMSDFDGDDGLRQAALRFAIIAEGLTDTHLPAIIAHLKSPSNETVDGYNTAVEYFNTEMMPVSSLVHTAKENFLKDHVPKPPKGQRRI